MTVSAMRIGLVVEGDSERRLFEELHPWFRDRGLDIKVVQAGGRPRLIQEARQHLEVLRLRNCERIFFLLDQDDELSMQTDDLDQPVHRLKQLFYRGRGHKYPTKTEMVRRLSRHFDLDRAASGNRSARRFVRKLAGVSSGL